MVFAQRGGTGQRAQRGDVGRTAEDRGDRGARQQDAEQRTVIQSALKRIARKPGAWSAGCGHGRRSRDRFRQAAELALALRKPLERVEQLLAAEIGPQRVDEQKLGIGGLPEQEIAEAVLAAGADQEVRLRQAAGEQAGSEKLRRDGLGIEAAFLGGAGQLARGIGDSSWPP